MFIRLSFNLLLCLLSSFSLEGQLLGMQASDWSVAIGRDKSGLEIQRELSGGVKISTERDMLERVTEQSIFSGSVEKSHMRFHWDLGNRLLRKTNLLTGESVHFDYDPWDNLFKADYKDGKQVETLYKAPDAIGNLFRTSERKDRKYGKSGRLLEDRKYSYHYDGEGNLVLKSRLRPEAPTTPLGQEGDWSYEWQGNGMLRRVRRPDGETVEFEYDPLVRRISKTYKGKTIRWVWDGNVPLHEWTEESDVTTWLFEEGTFVPTAKIVGDKSYSIITDYLGTPTHAFDSHGAKVWERNLDIYGKIRTGNSTLVPFLFQGQYFDEETDLCYNRFRYYSPDTGLYISQDPIGLAAGNPTLYAYVRDVNNRIDPLGLDDLYALVARKDGWYPVFEYGKKNPIGEMFLKEGDLWKIGTSKDTLKRYTQKYLNGIGVEVKVLHTNISRKMTLLLERMKIKGYEAWKGFLPPGNKCIINYVIWTFQ